MSSPSPAEIKQNIKQTFDLVAVGYDTPTMRYFPFSADHLANALRPMRGERILDVATGTGTVAITLAQLLGQEGRIQAIDISDKMLNKAEQNINKVGLNNIDLHNMDAEQLEFKSRYFDAASCGFGLFFLPDMQKGVKEIFRVLKPGGRFIYTAFASQAFAPLLDMFWQHLGEHGVQIANNGARRLSHEEECRTLLSQAGFSDIQIDRKQLGYHLASSLDWWEIIYNSGLRDRLEQLDPQHIAQFRQQHLAAVEQLKNDKGIWLDVEVLYVFGKRPD